MFPIPITSTTLDGPLVRGESPHFVGESLAISTRPSSADWRWSKVHEDWPLTVLDALTQTVTPLEYPALAQVLVDLMTTMEHYGPQFAAKYGWGTRKRQQPPWCTWHPKCLRNARPGFSVGVSGTSTRHTLSYSPSVSLLEQPATNRRRPVGRLWIPLCDNADKQRFDGYHGHPHRFNFRGD